MWVGCACSLVVVAVAPDSVSGLLVVYTASVAMWGLAARAAWLLFTASGVAPDSVSGLLANSVAWLSANGVA